MQIEIYKEEDRLIVAAILVKNGYKVCQRKVRKTPNSKAYIYLLDAEKVKPSES